MGNTKIAKGKDFPQVLYKTNIKPSRKTPKLLPNNLTLEEIIDKLPKEVFEKSDLKSAMSLLLTILFMSLSVYFIHSVPSYLYPIGWMLLGASVTGLFVIGNDCIHRSFSKSPIVNSIVGTIVMLPLLYPFQSCKITEKNNSGYTHINGTEKGFFALIKKSISGRYFWVIRSIVNWAESYFTVKNVNDKQDKKKAIISIILVYVFAFIFFPTVFKGFGMYGILNYWFAPWLVLHFLISSTNLIPRIPFFEQEKLGKTRYLVHIAFPKWFEFLIKDLNIMIPRHIDISIPHYNLRSAYDSFKKHWGDYIYECGFDYELIGELLDRSQSFSNEIFSPFDYGPAEFKFHKFQKEPEQTPKEATQRKSRTFQEFFQSLNWLHIFLLIGIPIVGIIGAMFVPLTKPTLILSIIYFHLSGMGITGGYHRLFAHKAYSGNSLMKLFWLLLGASAVQGSARWWCRDHRAHHRYVDTPKDPYSASEGFFWSHFGWLMFKQDPSRIGRSNIDDLNADKLVMWQHKNYIPIMAFMSFILPTAIAGIFWGDWWGGYIYAGLLRLVCVHHSTFFVNSLAHFLGSSPYDDKHTPRDSFITAVLTVGEGYHNFHHEFPSDYRNGYKFYHYDPTKWAIKIFHFLGMAYDLKTFPDNEIQKGMVQMAQKSIDSKKEKIYWGAEKHELPDMTDEEFQYFVKEENRKLIIIKEFVYDVEKFIIDHPGGQAYIKSGIGKDATKMFTGEVYDHSRAAQNLLCQFRIANYCPKEN
ncbi:delta 9 fatty acid desaturase [Tieghemostelium lacteum]|uniref:Delta 9 fatty acid desaturase n=1 Tax=Tieghemostelium lacteum TaxID=361077 RepID=A0A151Z3A7_TIELA|nr:delta 9 fatty acid desaturase [Tieghemostelium lacteum]|eukprot:KYQ88446.1 delta 9 fatty acid desaturase [Tieghemostelium lacteum]